MNMNINMGNGSSILMSDIGESVKSIFQKDNDIVTKQAEQIKMLREALERILSSIDEYSYVNEDGFNVVEVFDITHKCEIGNEALEATKEHA